MQGLNYFSHYYFDHREEELHNFGLVLPDFVRNFVKSKRLQPILENEDSEHLELLRIGTNRHFERDKKFHASGFFTRVSDGMTNIIKPVFQEVNIPRYWFASHLLTEMMLDRVLISENKEMADAFYRDLELANTGVIDMFLQNRGIDETGVFFERVTRFNQAKYLLQYVKDEAMVYSLNRIFMFTGADTEWNTEQFEALKMVMPDLESLIFENLNSLRQEML